MAEMRKNGLAAPYNGMQIGTWFLLPCILVEFIIFITPTIPSTIGSVFGTLLFVMSACFSIYYAYMTSATDPIDPRLHAFLKDDMVEECCLCMTPVSPSARLPTSEEDTKFCWVCQARVATASMHCKFCNKCVSNFDHHCQWLNTCIGDANYDMFVKTILSLCVMSYLQVFCSIAVLIAHFNTNGDHTYTNWWFTTSKHTVLLTWLLFTILFFIINTAVALLITQLLFFHFQLHIHQITTYQYIIQDNAKRRDKQRYITALHNKRKIELQNNNHHPFYKARLTIGQFPICKCIDPLQTTNKPTTTQNLQIISNPTITNNHITSQQIESFDVVPNSDNKSDASNVSHD